MSLTLNDIKHPKISTWVNEMIAMCEPDNVVVVDGSKEEYDALMQKCVKAGLATPARWGANIRFHALWAAASLAIGLALNAVPFARSLKKYLAAE